MRKQVWELSILVRGKTFIFNFDSKDEVKDKIDAILNWNIWEGGHWIRIKDSYMHHSEIDMVSFRRVM